MAGTTAKQFDPMPRFHRAPLLFWNNIIKLQTVIISCSLVTQNVRYSKMIAIDEYKE